MVICKFFRNLSNDLIFNRLNYRLFRLPIVLLPPSLLICEPLQSRGHILRNRKTHPFTCLSLKVLLNLSKVLPLKVFFIVVVIGFWFDTGTIVIPTRMQSVSSNDYVFFIRCVLIHFNSSFDIIFIYCLLVSFLIKLIYNAHKKLVLIIIYHLCFQYFKPFLIETLMIILQIVPVQIIKNLPMPSKVNLIFFPEL